MIPESLARILTERFGTRWIREFEPGSTGHHSEYVHGFIPYGEDGILVTRRGDRRYLEGEFLFYAYMGGVLEEFTNLIYGWDLAEGYRIYERSKITSTTKNTMLWSYECHYYGKREEQLIVRTSSGFSLVDEIISYEGSPAAVRYCGGCRNPDCCDAALYRLNKKGFWG